MKDNYFQGFPGFSGFWLLLKKYFLYLNGVLNVEILKTENKIKYIRNNIGEIEEYFPQYLLIK